VRVAHSGFPACSQDRDVLSGDNIQAHRLCKEHFVTTGNQHIYQPYHFNREAIEMGVVAISIFILEPMYIVASFAL
jgi:hypothetical protein